jgi:hypothetical protein
LPYAVIGVQIPWAMSFTKISISASISLELPGAGSARIVLSIVGLIVVSSAVASLLRARAFLLFLLDDDDVNSDSLFYENILKIK